MNTQLEEHACLFVLDRLELGERAAFEARLQVDPELAALVRDLEAALSGRVRALAQFEPPPTLLPGIEDHIGEPGSGAARRAPLLASLARWGIAAVIAVGIGILAVQSLRRPAAQARPYVIFVGLDSLGSRLAELPMQGRAPGADESFVQLASLAEKFWEKPEDLPVRLDSSGQRGRGYALYDPGSDQGFIAIRQLPPAESGKQYRLWLLETSTGRIRQACALPAAGSTTGLYFFHVPEAGGEKLGRLDFFVTAEDASSPDSAQPRGAVVLGDRRI
jgi:hypothetical protein